MLNYIDFADGSVEIVSRESRLEEATFPKGIKQCCLNPASIFMV